MSCFPPGRLLAVALVSLLASACATTAGGKVGGLDEQHREPDLVLVTHRVDTLSHHDVTTISGLQVTSVTRTLLDLAKDEPPAMVRAAVDEALRRKLTDLDKLEAALERVPREPGTAFLKQLIAGYRGDDGPSESELEARVMELFDAYGLPRPVRQRTVRAGKRERRLDFLVPGTNVVIEGDGYAYHSSVEVFEKDRERNNALIARGYRVLHWTWAAMRERPDELAEQLLAVLARPSANQPSAVR